MVRNMQNLLHLGLKYLNSGFYIGFIEDVYAIVSHIIDEYKMKPSENDQKYFHYVYMDENLRKKHKIRLDHYSQIVYNSWDANENELQINCVQGSLK